MSTTTTITHPDGTTIACTTSGAEAAAPAAGSVEIHGMEISANVLPPMLIAMDSGAGGIKPCNLMTGEHLKPEFLAINPWHQIPSMRDGDFCLGESNAICRYLAAKYAPALYGGGAEAKATVDWALDWCSSNFYNNYKSLWYPVAGFGAAPESYPEECKKAYENLATFEAQFLSSGKFISGDALSIADYKVAVWFWYLSLPAIKAVTGFELPARCATYVADFMAASKNAKAVCEGTPAGFIASKMPAP